MAIETSYARPVERSEKNKHLPVVQEPSKVVLKTDFDSRGHFLYAVMPWGQQYQIGQAHIAGVYAIEALEEVHKQLAEGNYQIKIISHDKAEVVEGNLERKVNVLLE
jgi:hypothetical protein